MTNQPGRPRDDDSLAVLAALGNQMPILLRESIDHGFFNYAKSRKADADGFAELSDCSRANVLYDRITSVARNLIEAAGLEHLHWQIGDNKRATEIFLDPHFAFRIKRIKRNRGDLTAGVDTGRRKKIQSPSRLVPIGQMVLALPGFKRPMRYESPLWITAAFDLDDVEESVSRIFIGIERRRHFLWRVPVPEAAPGVISTLHAPLAEKIMELRKSRAA